MKKKLIINIISIIIILLIPITYLKIKSSEPKIITSKLDAIIISKTDNDITIITKNDSIYTFPIEKIKGNINDNIIIEYIGSLEALNEIQNVEITNYKITKANNQINIPTSYQDNGIFSKYYEQAYKKLNELTLDEKIGQLILARYPNKDILTNLKKYQIGGYIFYEKDFKDKTEQEIKEMINNLQNNTNIPLLIAVDEEGGKVVRVSSNKKLIKEKFKSSQELYSLGGLSEIKEDTIKKSKFLSNLGINLNLAPVIDVSTNKTDYMYERSIGKNSEITSLYSKTVIEASKGLDVSYTLKHFPGYGNNIDTHQTTSIDERTYETILSNDIIPFKTGIEVGAEAVLISHNIVTNIDPNNPASLSIKIHNILRNELKFTGIIITDDLSMGATKEIKDANIKAILSANNLIITTDYIETINSIKTAILNGTINEELINKLTFKIIAWKYYKGLMI